MSDGEMPNPRYHFNHDILLAAACWFAAVAARSLKERIWDLGQTYLSQ